MQHDQRQTQVHVGLVVYQYINLLLLFFFLNSKFVDVSFFQENDVEDPAYAFAFRSYPAPDIQKLGSIDSSCRAIYFIYHMNLHVYYLFFVFNSLM